MGVAHGRVHPDGHMHMHVDRRVTCVTTCVAPRFGDDVRLGFAALGAAKEPTSWRFHEHERACGSDVLSSRCEALRPWTPAIGQVLVARLRLAV